MEPIIITIPKNEITTENKEVVLENSSLKNLIENDKKLGVELINENGLNLKAEDILINSQGKVIINNDEFRESLRSRVLKPDFVALNICGLCKVS